MTQAIADAGTKGFLGSNIQGSGFDLEIIVHRGAGAYICGEETALLESLEGKLGQPRVKPPFPANFGLYGKPTAGNNVETLCNVPLIVKHGAEGYAALGPEKNGGPKLYCISGHVARPGVYEASMHVTLRQLIDDYAGGMRNGRPLKAIIPGGSSTPVLLPDALDAQASFEGIAKAGPGGAFLGQKETAKRIRAGGNLIVEQPRGESPPADVLLHQFARQGNLAGLAGSQIYIENLTGVTAQLTQGRFSRSGIDVRRR